MLSPETKAFVPAELCQATSACSGEQWGWLCSLSTSRQWALTHLWTQDTGTINWFVVIWGRHEKYELLVNVCTKYLDVEIIYSGCSWLNYDCSVIIWIYILDSEQVFIHILLLLSLYIVYRVWESIETPQQKLWLISLCCCKTIAHSEDINKLKKGSVMLLFS